MSGNRVFPYFRGPARQAVSIQASARATELIDAALRADLLDSLAAISALHAYIAELEALRDASSHHGVSL